MKMLFGDLSFSSTSPLKKAAWEAGGEVAGIKKNLKAGFAMGA